LAVREPAAEEAVTARHAVHRRARRGELALDRGGELRGYAFVGVEAQHPVVLGLLDRELLLAAEAEPLPMHHARTFALRELARAVGRSRVDHDDFIDESKAVEAGLEDCGGVAGDENGRERVYRRGVQYDSILANDNNTVRQDVLAWRCGAELSCGERCGPRLPG